MIDNNNYNYRLTSTRTNYYYASVQFIRPVSFHFLSPRHLFATVQLESGFKKAVLDVESYLWTSVAAILAERQDDIHEKEWKPAADERRHDDGHGPGSLPLLGQTDLGLLIDEFVDLVVGLARRERGRELGGGLDGGGGVAVQR